MKLFKRKSTKCNLTLEDFREECVKNKTSITTSPKLLKLLQKDGFAKNTKAGTTSSTIEISTFNANVEIGNNSVIVSFDGNEIKNKTTFISVINKKVEWLKTNINLIDKKIIEDLLELKNSTWFDKNESSFDEKEFTTKFKLKAINFSSDKSFELEFDDGDSFGGHSIMIRIDDRFKIESVRI